MFLGIFDSPLDLMAMVCLALVSLVPMICGCYVIIHYLLSFKHPKLQKTRQKTPKNKIAVVIPAHNEEKVIAQAVRSALASDYPRELFDVLVIADNCDDATAAEAERAGALVHTRINPTVRSKAAALKWLFYQQGLLSTDYDSICILDADTLVTDSFLRTAESAMQEGHVIVQGRGYTSNMDQSPIAYGMGLIEVMQNRFWHIPMRRRGLSDLYTGKGVLISRAHIRRLGWTITTLVEDLEFSLQTVLAGEDIYFCHDAVFYSEQVPDYALFWRQQRRWTSGQIACSYKYMGELHRAATKHSHKDAFPALIYCLLPFSMAIGFVNIFLSPLLTAAATHLYAVSIIASLVSLALQYLGIACFGALLTHLEGRSILRHLRGIVTLPLLTISLGLVNLVSFFRPKEDWEAMQHASGALKTGAMHKIRG